ncbi:TfoX/Sxy family protein [Algoriphagus mannitolivorans]|uniref:TfoX/Sxy family protein n=1 Tax=Algoriphagus mannitolivorans TaxID=226504 RepID=UPI0003FBFF8E|nr:TfoX/Sxy family protein [Algoriphagus mannitolivorans]
MAFDSYQFDRISQNLKQRKAPFTFKKMMGGAAFFLDEKMLLGLDQDKNTGENRLMARIGEEASQQALLKPGCRPMDFTGRPMKGYVYVYPEGLDADEQLDYWIGLCLAFNPQAKKSKK